MRAGIHHLQLLLWRLLAGAMFGAGFASLAEAGTGAHRSFGPAAVQLLGYDVPLMSALFGVLGVVLARRVAPIDPAAERLGAAGNAALTTLLALGVLAFIIAGEKRPIVALGWAVGLGYSGIAFVALVAEAVKRFAKSFLEAFVRGAAGSSAGRDGEAS
jgi:hypothetical protein